jgi:hypothetical protein
MIDRRVEVTTTAVSALRSRVPRRSVRSELTAVDDHIEIDSPSRSNVPGQVFQTPLKCSCTARLGETRQEEPVHILLSRQGQRLVEDRLPQRATVAVCLATRSRLLAPAERPAVPPGSPVRSRIQSAALAAAR